MAILDPGYLHVVLSFSYRGWVLELDQGKFKQQLTYAVWAKNSLGCAIAVPCAFSHQDAIRKAKKWVDQRQMWQ